MSRQLLESLNGNHQGLFRDYLDSLESEPRIAWYPSAGEDFRSLLYLSKQYSDRNPSKDVEPQAPNLFLFTDYFPWETSTFLDNRTIYDDDNTSIRVTAIEELPRISLPLHEEIVDFPEGGSALNRVVFMYVHVTSHLLGEFDAPVLYVFSENEAFYCNAMVPHNARLSHIVRIRYGGGLGGGKASGAWIDNTLGQLGCEVFIKDEDATWQPGDDHLKSICPELPTSSDASLTRIRQIPGHLWSGYHDNVSWYLVE